MITAHIKASLLTTISNDLSQNEKSALLKGAIVGTVTAIIYLVVVVITTPNLPPSTAIGAALKVNGIIIIGLVIGIGIQIFSSTYSKGLGCSLDERRKRKQQHKGIWRVFGESSITDSSTSGSGASSGGGAVMSSFLSFFSLVPLGCCGSWLFILSMLPSALGGTVSVILIKYSTLLSYVGLVVVLGFAALSILRLRKRLIEMRVLGRQNPDHINFDNDNENKNTSTLENKLEKKGDEMYDIDF